MRRLVHKLFYFILLRQLECLVFERLKYRIEGLQTPTVEAAHARNKVLVEELGELDSKETLTAQTARVCHSNRATRQCEIAQTRILCERRRPLLQICSGGFGFLFPGLLAAPKYCASRSAQCTVALFFPSSCGRVRNSSEHHSPS